MSYKNRLTVSFYTQEDIFFDADVCANMDEMYVKEQKNLKSQSLTSPTLIFYQKHFCVMS